MNKFIEYIFCFLHALVVSSAKAEVYSDFEKDEVKSFLMHYHPRDKKNLEDSRLPWQLLEESPARAAKMMARKGDFRFIGLNFGMAPGNQSDLTGVKCKKSPPIRRYGYGCMAPSPVFAKMVQEFNHTLMRLPEFPDKAGCHISKEIDEYIKYMEDSRKEITEMLEDVDKQQ